MAEVDDGDEVPEEIEESCLECHEALARVDRLLKPVLSVSRTSLEERLDELEAASLILLLAYTMNSLFWVYLTTQGVNPKSHPVKKELERLQKAMGRAKILTERQKRAQPKMNVGVAKRLVRGALWEQKPLKRPRDEGEGQGVELSGSKRPANQS